MKHTCEAKSTILTKTGTMLSILLCTLTLHAENDGTTHPGNDGQYPDTAAVLPKPDTLPIAPENSIDIPDQSETNASQPIETDTQLSTNDVTPTDSIPGDSIQSGTDSVQKTSAGTPGDDTTSAALSETATAAPAEIFSENSSLDSPAAVITEQPDTLERPTALTPPAQDATMTPTPQAALSDSIPAKPEQPVTATNAALQKLDKRTKVLVAAGTSAAILGAAAFILVKQFNDDHSQKDTDIPDPPAPPGYW